MVGVCRVNSSIAVRNITECFRGEKRKGKSDSKRSATARERKVSLFGGKTQNTLNLLSS